MCQWVMSGKFETQLQPNDLGWITNFIWGIADDVLRDLYVRGKYRDVILPMTVLRRLDAVLEPTKQAVLDMKASARQGGHHEPGRRVAAGRGAGVLQHVQVHAPRPARPRQPAAAQGRLRSLPRRLLAERAGHPRQVRVPQPDPPAVEGRCPRHPDREVPRPSDQPRPAPRQERRRLDQAIPASTTMRWARSSRSWSAASTRRTTRRPASTGRRAMPSS